MLSYLEDELALEFLEVGGHLRSALDRWRWSGSRIPDSALVAACEQIRTVTRRVLSALSGPEEKTDPERRQAAAAVKEVFDVAERMVALSEHDVVWVADRDRFGREARVAPLSVAGLMRDRVFAERTVGPDLGDAQARRRLRPDRGPGLRPRARRRAGDARARRTGRSAEGDRAWRARRRLAVRLPPAGHPLHGPGAASARPGRAVRAALAEIAELVWAAGGRTLGLFSSRRAAEAAAVFVRKQLPKMTVLCQGEAQLPELTRRFVADESASLFGTLSLWQGVDVPGATCQLVIIDRIPFPRPDEPLTLARQRAVAEAGGNGFMAVAASHAALLLAQGSGRLIRRLSDRGVVAVLDPRLLTARYGSFLRSSMPDMWPTTDREVVIGALRRLAAASSGEIRT